jgi:hypothetical protein
MQKNPQLSLPRKLYAFIQAMIRYIYCRLFWNPPVYDPAKWNDHDGIQHRNNCYNYACNKQTGTYAQPGQASGHMYTSFDCTSVSSGASSDGLISLVVLPPPLTILCGRCSHKVALVIRPAPHPDFHWYRRDANGMWSHKPGGTEARNVDNAGKPISDPRTCDRGPYTIFCGFFCVSDYNDDVRIG